MKLHHVGVAVRSLEEGIRHYESLGLRLAHREDVLSQQVKVAFMGEGPYVELLEPTSAGSPVSKFLDKKGPGQHHVAYAVPDLAAALAREMQAGRAPIDAAARPGAWGHEVAFLHPRHHGGVLIELLEERPARV
ncbi:MAG: methylmalonyl-CoA epimerase [Elusimicrobia bacterium]|nr:methylmalonyl-CoA epimerase [Elusimicrobiota bacterium]